MQSADKPQHDKSLKEYAGNILAIIGGVGALVVGIITHDGPLAVFAALTAVWAGLAWIRQREYYLLERQFQDYVNQHKESNQ